MTRKLQVNALKSAARLMYAKLGPNCQEELEIFTVLEPFPVMPEHILLHKKTGNLTLNQRLNTSCWTASKDKGQVNMFPVKPNPG